MAKGVPETHPEERNALNISPRKNWLEKAGGLPSYINSVAVALVRGGMPRERAIPTAVNVVKKTCATGLWGGRPKAKVSPAIRAAACRAAAEWEAKKGGAKLSACADCSKRLDLAGPVVTSKADQSVTVNALMQGMRPRHVKALAKANRNLQRSGMPVAKRRKVLRSMAKGLKSGRVSLSAPLAGSRSVDLALNPSEARGFHGRWVKTLNRIAKLKVGGDSVRVPLPESERRRTGLKMKRIERVASRGARQFRVQHAAHYTHHATPLAALHAAITPSAGRAGNVRSFSHSVDLAFNPSEMRAPKGAAGGGRWAKGGPSKAQQRATGRQAAQSRTGRSVSKLDVEALAREKALEARGQRTAGKRAQLVAVRALIGAELRRQPQALNAHQKGLLWRVEHADGMAARVQAGKDLVRTLKGNAASAKRAARAARPRPSAQAKAPKAPKPPAAKVAPSKPAARPLVRKAAMRSRIGTGVPKRTTTPRRLVSTL